LAHNPTRLSAVPLIVSPFKLQLLKRLRIIIRVRGGNGSDEIEIENECKGKKVYNYYNNINCSF